MRLIDKDTLPIVAHGKIEHKKYVFANITDAPIIPAIPVEWLEKVRKDDRLTIDDVETIDLILTWWQKEQEAQK